MVLSPTIQRIIIAVGLFAYLTLGLYTELRLTYSLPIPEELFQDFKFYERALDDALGQQDPYAVRSIGVAYLYPPPALLVVEIFHYISPFLLRVAIYSVVNLFLLGIIVYGIALHYRYSIANVWYWFVLCLGFAPFFELLHFVTNHVELIHRSLTLYILTAIGISGLLTYGDRSAREPLFIVTSLGMMLSSNIMWYHHYIFILLPLLIWMGWSRLKLSTVIWCFAGLLIIQFDRWLPPYGLWIHLFGHLSILMILAGQICAFVRGRLRVSSPIQAEIS